MGTAKQTRTLKPDEWYTLSDLVNMNMFPFCGTDIRRYRSAVKADKMGADILRTVIRGHGMGMRYTFKGENVLKFIRGVESGKVKL